MVKKKIRITPKIMWGIASTTGDDKTKEDDKK